MIHIDGSYMEGGGQIVRTALALSTLTGRPFQIDRIRHHRPRPGLKRQHLSCIDALIQMADARVEGARPGSDRVVYFPGKISGGTVAIDIGTAGSITLLLQALLLPCMFADADVRLNINGGTDTRWSIPIDFFANLILPFFNTLASIAVTRIKRGFYPKGQGRVDLVVAPRYHLSEFRRIDDLAGFLQTSGAGIHLDSRPEIKKIQGVSAASSRLKGAAVAERQLQGAVDIIAKRLPIRVESAYEDTASAGTVITLWAATKAGRALIGADALGQKGVPAERIGAAAAQKMIKRLDSAAAVDHHLADNLIPLLALVGGTIKTDKISGHIRSNIYVCEQFLDVSFNVDETNHRITAIH